jgi:AraC-like DNA-binding protein
MDGLAAEVRTMLLAQGLIVRDCASFGLTHHIYIAVQRPVANDRLVAALSSKAQKIIDIALTYRFNAPESFPRAFRRSFVLQPRQTRSGWCWPRYSAKSKSITRHFQSTRRFNGYSMNCQR